MVGTTINKIEINYARIKKEYREQNKDRIKEHATQRITCICGLEIRRADKAKHERTAKHQRIVNEAET